MLGKLLEFVGGLYQLARLGVLSGFNFRTAYWQWRLHTAFGKGYPRGGRGEMIRAAIGYGMWMHRMRRDRWL